MTVTLWSATRQHPVGQGSFLSGWVTDGTRSLTYVYDCGCLRDGKGIVRERETDQVVFESAVGRNRKFDLLFLSHLDVDHVNGLPQLLGKWQPARIVMPMVPLFERIALLTRGAGDPFVRGLIVDPAAALGDLAPEASIIQLDPGIDEEDEAGEVGILEGLSDGDLDVDLPLTTSSPRRRTRAQVTSGGLPLWVIRAWVLKGLDDLNDELAVELGLPGRDALDAVFLAGALATSKGRRQLRTACRRVLKAAGQPDDFNRTSLCLYSGPAGRPKRSFRTRKVRIGMTAANVHDREEAMIWGARSGYLGTGDATLASSPVRAEFAAEFARWMPLVGTFAIPHHGSHHNWHADLLVGFDRPPVCVASFGLSNRYGHPHSETVRSISAQGSHFVGVTEDPRSGFTQAIRVEFG